MYGPQVLGSGAAVASAATLAVTGTSNKVVFIAALSMLVLSTAVLVISKIASAKN